MTDHMTTSNAAGIGATSSMTTATPPFGALSLLTLPLDAALPLLLRMPRPGPRAT